MNQPGFQLSTWLSSRFLCVQSGTGYVSRKQACKMRYGSQMRSLEGLHLSLLWIQGTCESSDGDVKGLWARCIPLDLLPQSFFKFLPLLRVNLCKTQCKCLLLKLHWRSKISIKMGAFSHHCWLRFHTMLVKMDGKKPLKWSQHRSLVKCIAIGHYNKEEETDGKFSVTEAVCELEVPSELPRQNSAELYISKPEMGERAAHISLSSVGK